jgi:hypothetical protein
MGRPSRWSSANPTRSLLCFVLLVLHVPVIFGEVDTRDASATAGLAPHHPPQIESRSEDCAYLRTVPADPEIDPGFLLPIPPSWPYDDKQYESIPPRVDGEGPCHPLDAHKPIFVEPPALDLPDSTLPSERGSSISVH